jgi:hypothetical protein
VSHRRAPRISLNDGSGRGSSSDALRARG